MRCSEAQEQLVAAHDGELGPSAMTVLNEHLAHCARCRAWDERLRALTIETTLRVPRDVQRRLAVATDPMKIVPAAARRPQRPWSVIAGAAIVLVIASVTGGRVWLDRTTSPTAKSVIPSPIPASDYRPAAYQPDAAGHAPTYDTNTLHLPGPATDEGIR